MQHLVLSEQASAAADNSALNPIRANLAGSSIYRKPFDAKMLGPDRRRVQMVTEGSRLIAYFLDNPPDNIHVSTLPKTAREIVVARVNLLRRPVYLVGRDQSGRPPSARPSKNLYFVQLKILDVRSGDAAVGAIFEARFGVPNSSRSQICQPLTLSQLSRDYFVVIYVDEDDQRRLAGFPISETQYQEWEDEVRDFGHSPGIPQ
jgi:hypothetical protein